MERLSDAEDFIPPTPRNPKKQFPLVGKNSSPSKSQSATSKLSRNTGRLSKRKKISGVSPEFKKFKDKTNQVTLFNYLKKNANSLTDDGHSHPVKMKLFREFEPTSVTTSSCSHTVKFDTAIDCDTNDFKNNSPLQLSVKMKCNPFELTSIATSNRKMLQIDSKNTTVCTDCANVVPTDSILNPEISFSDKEKLISEIELTTDTTSNCNNSVQSDIKNAILSDTDISIPNICKEESTINDKLCETAKRTCVLETSNYQVDCSPKTKLSTDRFLSTNEICNDVGNMSLDFDERDEISDYTLSECVMQAGCDVTKKPCENNLNLDLNKSTADMEQSFSWMDDFDWKGCDIEKENCLDTSK